MRLLAHVHMAPPHHNAGSEVTLMAIFRGMVERGHECQLISVEYPERYREVDGVHIHLPPPEEPERSLWFRQKFDWCDVAVTHLNCTGHAMHLARESAKPLVHLIHNTSQIKFHNIRPIRAQLLIYNSEWVRETTPMNPSMVVHPIIEPEMYQVERPDPQTVTFVNLTVTKGALVFYELARRLPDVPFVGVRGAYGDQHEPPSLPNLTIHEQMPNLALPSGIYANTKVVLMPSDYESYGRVAVEAACSGIPSIVHPTPGLKEALGAAGIYVDRNDIDAYEKELRLLLDDEVYYNERSVAALDLAKSLDPEASLTRIEDALRVVHRHGLSHTGWTYEALGAEGYQQKAKALGHFDPSKEPVGFRPSLGGIELSHPSFTTDRRIYLDSEGRPVEQSSRNKQMLFLGIGATISFDQALEMGILNEAGIPFWERYETQAFDAPFEKQAFDEPNGNGRVPLNSDAVSPLTKPQSAKVPRARRG